MKDKLNLNSDKFVNIMVDLETLSTKPNAAILTIGAVSFSGKVDNIFYNKIDRKQYDYSKWSACPSTLDWWGAQRICVAAEAFSGTSSPRIVLEEFASWLNSFNKEIIIWSNGANFDEVILCHAFDTFNLEVPWNYKNVMCFRTLKNLYPGRTLSRDPATEHNALSDAIYQAEYALLVLNP